MLVLEEHRGTRFNSVINKLDVWQFSLLSLSIFFIFVESLQIICSASQWNNVKRWKELA